MQNTTLCYYAKAQIREVFAGSSPPNQGKGIKKQCEIICIILDITQNRYSAYNVFRPI
jgi:hypothetical protein